MEVREILFRGKRTDNDEWVEGYYGQFHNRPIHKGENSHQIFVLMEDATVFGSMIGGLWHEVVPETVGQYTGLIDKNRKKIFEGDIVAGALLGLDRPVNCVVVFRNGSYGVRWRKRQFFQFSSMFSVNYEVIGNIYDNPELFEGGNE